MLCSWASLWTLALTALHSEHGVGLPQSSLGPSSVMTALPALPCTWLKAAVRRCTPGWSQGADKPCVWACRLWAASDLQHIKTIEVGKAWVTDCLYLPSARRLICTSADRAVRRQHAPAPLYGMHLHVPGACDYLTICRPCSSKGSGLHCSLDTPQ